VRYFRTIIQWNSTDALQDDFTFKEIKLIPSPKLKSYPIYALLGKLHLTGVMNYNQDKFIKKQTGDLRKHVFCRDKTNFASKANT